MKTSEQIIQDAKTSDEIPKEYNLLDMLLYLVIKQILKMYSNRQISKEQANKLKTKAIKEYENNKKQFEFKQSIWTEYIENINKTEDLRRKLRIQLNSNTDLDEILNTCIELIQLYSKEEFV